ncbi:helix-turn-helix domain-containing protein [Georgenia alba]|uniref:Helix-turn-helix domain-containing protein n=1 Tax=Georgenia alba TaxID=2233858 RepID=A0ABW2Q802_9MICO
MRLKSSNRDHLLADDLVTEQAEQVAGAFEDLLRERAELELREEHADARPVPVELAQLLARVVETVAKGGAVTIETMPSELTTTAAAGMLGISRPTLMKMVDRGEVPAHKVGSHTRLRTDDVLAAKRRRLDEQRRAFEALRQMDEELGLD